MKKLVIVLTALILAFPLSAFEWGGLLTEDFKYQNNELDTTYKQSNSLSLWVNLPLMQDSSCYFAGQSSFKYYYDVLASNGSQLMPIADIDLAKFAGKTSIKNSVLSIAAGRYSISDLTGKILNQNSDGLTLKVSVPGIEYSLYAGYTGLLNSLNVSMLGENNTVHQTETAIYSTTHSYIPALLVVDIPSAFFNQSITGQVSVFYDVESTNYSRYYFTAGMSGPIAGPLYYSLSASLGTATFKDFFAYGCLNLQAFISNFTVKVIGEYASGNQFGLVPFTTFTSCTAYNSSISPELTGVFLPGVDVSYTIGSIYASLAGKFVMGYPESEIIIKGVNANCNFVWNIFSDLKTGLSGIYYYDIENSGSLNNLSVAFNLSLSF